MTHPFADHFQSVARQYADNRPTYPAELFAWLAGQCAGHELAWDVGTGSGQAARDLARHFAQVLASDASAEQIAQAPAQPGIAFRLAPAEASGLPERSVDLISVAQALHWFDLDAFYAEARRVLKPGGLIAAWTYGILHVDGDALDGPVQHFYHQVVGPYWPTERRHVESGYRDLPFPFPRLAAPAFAMQADWTLEQLQGYLRSWSATARYRQAHGSDPLTALAAELAPRWGDPANRRRIRWPLALLCGRAD